MERHQRRAYDRTKSEGVGRSRVLCTKWALSSAFYPADDGDPGAGGGGGTDRRGVAEAGEGTPRGRRAAWRERVLSGRRSPGDRGPRFWNGKHSPRGQDRRPGQLVCDLRKKNGCFRL